MKRIIYIILLFILLASQACSDFFDLEQDLVLSESKLPSDEVELRSMSLGLYSLQQDLVEQIVILGELRGDLLNVTENAGPDLVEVNNLYLTPNNRYASPVGFYKLIAACNKLIWILQTKYPEVEDKESAINNYHYMYGEAICMRSWAYFNAARIFNEIPYIPETLTSIEEINDYVNSPGVYVDSIYIDFSPNGLGNDTIRDSEEIFQRTYVYEDKKYLKQDAMVQWCINDIEEKVRVVGVKYKDDESWQTTIWNQFAMHTLLGNMSLHIGDYEKAIKNYNILLEYEPTNNDEYRFCLTEDLAFESWRTIFTSINKYEHIFSLWFGKSNASWQMNNLQHYFSNRTPNIYAIKPTKKAIHLWETVWRDYIVTIDKTSPELTYTSETGQPGDIYRGHNTSYLYLKNGIEMTEEEVEDMLELKRIGKWDEVEVMMSDVDTVVYKYSIGKDIFDQDANFMVFRAASVHLNAAEIYLWNREASGSNLYKVDQYLFNGDYVDLRDERLGVAGRVGLDRLDLNQLLGIGSQVVYEFNPYTNQVAGYQNLDGIDRQRYYQENVLFNERAREMAFEGERYYDLVRVARRYNKMGLDGGEWLGYVIAEKFPENQREEVKARLRNSDNWYLPFRLE